MDSALLSIGVKLSPRLTFRKLAARQSPKLWIICRDLYRIAVRGNGPSGNLGHRHDLLNVVLGGAAADEYHTRLRELPLEVLITVDGQRHTDRTVSQRGTENREPLSCSSCEDTVIVSNSFTHHLE